MVEISVIEAYKLLHREIAYLVEERTARVEVEEKSACLGDKLEAANILQTCKHCEVMEREVNESRSIIEKLESQQIMLISELAELKKKRDSEITRLNNELDLDHRQKDGNKDDSPLQRKFKRMQASLEKARKLNTKYQIDQASHCFAEKEMDEVRRQVEIETANVIECLELDLISLQHQLNASNKNDLLAKQSINELQLEIKQLNDKLLEVLKENEIFSSVIEEKEKEIRLLTNDWNRLAADIESCLLDGNAALDESCDQVAFISKSLSQRNWIVKQVREMCSGISEREELLEELQNRLKEADNIRCDLDLKLRSLRGAMQAVNQEHQQEKCDQEKEMYLLRSRISEQGHVNSYQVKQIHRINLLLDESIETFVQKEVLEQNYFSLQKAMGEEIHRLESQLDQSKVHSAHLLSQTQDKEQATGKLKNEEFNVLLGLMSDVLKANGIIRELRIGFNTLQSNLSMSPEETTCQNSDLNLEDRVS